MKWITCWPFAGQALGYTQWDPTISGGGGWEGTYFIAFVKYQSCDSGATLYPYNFASTDAGTGQLDFQWLLEHEMGHGFGLHHPEGAAIIDDRPGSAQYPLKSWDGNAWTIMRETMDYGRTVRVLRQDDASGGSWADRFEILARPDTRDYWAPPYQGTLLDGGTYIILTKNSNLPASEDYSYTYMTTRVSTDGRSSRQTPTFIVRWRESSGQSSGSNDRLRLRLAWEPVYQDGSVGAWQYTFGPNCYDTHSDGTWETCQVTFSIGNYEVQDIRAYIYNSTNTRVQLDSISLKDGT
jgi:hypothetical protein